MEKCLTCGKEFKTERGLHLHTKAHGGMETYYHTHFPRKDYYDGIFIEFKNKKQYLSSFFNSTVNRKRFYKQDSKNISLQKEVLLKEFKCLMEKKGFDFLPSENFLYLSKFAKLSLFKRLFGSVESFCQKARVSRKLPDKLPEDFWTKDSFDEMEVFVDTREQSPFYFKNSLVNKLDFGDYTSPSHYTKTFVERKSVMDFVSSFGAGFERLQKEIDRAKDFNSYIVIVVEGSISDAYKQSRRLKKGPNLDFAFSNVRKLLIENADNCQIVFCKNREEAQDLTSRVLFFGNEIKNCDLQNELNDR